jgi:DNA-binding IclR family transcriptional regulator
MTNSLSRGIISESDISADDIVPPGRRREALDEEDLREEQTLNAPDRVLLTLIDGPAIADGIAQMARIPLGTVRNALHKVERQELIEPTGEFRLKSRVFGLTVEGEARASLFTHY